MDDMLIFEDYTRALVAKVVSKSRMGVVFIDLLMVKS
jgi:hypothetical protein